MRSFRIVHRKFSLSKKQKLSFEFKVSQFSWASKVPLQLQRSGNFSGTYCCLSWKNKTKPYQLPGQPTTSCRSSSNMK